MHQADEAFLAAARAADDEMEREVNPALARAGAATNVFAAISKAAEESGSLVSHSDQRQHANALAEVQIAVKLATAIHDARMRAAIERLQRVQQTALDEVHGR